MAALTFSQIEAQVRALLSDAGAGSSEFTPEQMARAVDFAQVHAAKQLGITYYESSLEVINKRAAIPFDAISVIRVEIGKKQTSGGYYGPLGIRIGSDPDYESFTFGGNAIDAQVVPTASPFHIVEIGIKPPYSIGCYAPGDHQTYRILVTDLSGNPLSAEIVVDGFAGNVVIDEMTNSATITLSESDLGEVSVGDSYLRVYGEIDSQPELLIASYQFV